MTYRERREARAEKRRDWAASREQKSNAAYAGVRRIADGIPFGQPILVGHHSEKHARADAARIDNGMRASVEHSKMAAHHEQAADEIERQLARSIYDDDPDAVERLTEKVAALEAKRDQMKTHNVAIRKALKGQPESEWPRIIAEQHAPDWGWRPGCGIWMVVHNLTNTTANIARARERIAILSRPKALKPARTISARRAGRCADCATPIKPGDYITETEPSTWVHGRCHEKRSTA